MDKIRIQAVSNTLENMEATYCTDITPKNREKDNWDSVIKYTSAGIYGCPQNINQDFYCFKKKGTSWSYSPYQETFNKKADFLKRIESLNCPQEIMYSEIIKKVINKKQY